MNKEEIFKKLLTMRVDHGRGTDLSPRAFNSAPGALDRDLDRLRRSPYPTEDCLMPYEVESIVEDGEVVLSDKRLTHVRGCSFCSPLLALVQQGSSKPGESVGAKPKFAKRTQSKIMGTCAGLASKNRKRIA